MNLIIAIIKKIPFVIAMFCFISILVVKIMNYLKLKVGNIAIISKITSFIFDPQTPFYFNYGIFYAILAMSISIVFAVTKIYNVFETTIGVGINLVLFVIMLTFIIARM